jgi:hypothetical protein
VGKLLARSWRFVVASGLSAILMCGTAQGAESKSPAELAYRAGKATGDDKEARPHFQQGIAAARGALSQRPDDPAALLWLAANLGGEALTHGRMHALGAVSEIESTLLRLEQTHPQYEHAAAARGLANLYWKAPSVISVGSSKKAARYFELALQRAPDYPANQAMAAAFYADDGDCGRARPLATAVQNRRDLGAFGGDATEWKRLAAKALDDCK